MNYKKLKANLLLKQKLYESSIRELQFEKLKNSCLYNILDEVEELSEKRVNQELIRQVIENAKQRHFLDQMIHAELIFKP